VADPVQSDNAYPGLGGFSVSADGRVAYRAGTAPPRQLTWFDRTGKASPAAEPDSSVVVAPALSPDFRRVAAERTVQDKVDI